MRGVFTWGRIGAASVAAILLALILLYWLVGRTSDSPDSPALSVHEAVRIAAQHVASNHDGGGGCNKAEFDGSRGAWVVSCDYYDTDKCRNEGHSISCGPDARLYESVLVDDRSAGVLEAR